MRQLTSIQRLDLANTSRHYVRATTPRRKRDMHASLSPPHDRSCWREDMVNLAFMVLASGLVPTTSAVAIWQTYLALLQYSSLDLINALTGA